MGSRRKRGTRTPPKSRLMLQPRDHAMLRWIGRAGVVELPQLAALFWPGGTGSRAAAARRLRKLTDHHLVDTIVVSLDRPNRVTLTQRGAERVDGNGLVLRTRIRGASTAADHLIQSAELWSALLRRCRADTTVRLSQWLTEAEIRRALGSSRQALIPDGIAILAGAAGEVVVAIEVDLDTEPMATIRRKFTRYAPHLAERKPLYGLALDALLVVAPGQRRLRKMAATAGRTAAGRATFFQDLARLSPDTVLDELATVASLGRTAGQGADPFILSLTGRASA